MLSLPAAVRVFACTTPVDMRKSFHGLAATVESALGTDPMNGQVFCMFSRNAQHIRLLWWDGDGWLLVAKRLEKGRFQMPWALTKPTAPLPVSWAVDPDDLTAILRGVDLRSIKRLPRWRPSN